jgi:XTP/dITP diphosphohydrolase
MSARAPLTLASGNAGKAREFGRLLADVFVVQALPPGVALPAETAATFAGNARIKAEAVFLALGGRTAVLADDSGLEVAALGGRPGIFSARYAGEGAGDADNVAKLLEELAGCADRRARFVCCLCLLLPARTGPDVGGAVAAERIEVEGSTEGTITAAPRGTDGFGYDPVFQPLGWSQTLAEAEPGAKDAVSHRGAAARALIARLREKGLAAGGS